MKGVFVTLLFLSVFCSSLRGEESFCLIDGDTGQVVYEFGPNIDRRVTPCSTFKIVFCLMGFDSGILKNEYEPVWSFQEGYVDWMEVWKGDQTPTSWIKNSCLWYSRVLSQELGLELIQNYIEAFEYGNQDFSGGVTSAWLNSSLQISPREQAQFIQKMVQGNLPISKEAVEMTKSILFLEQLSEGWNLYGKTGYLKKGSQSIGWIVGWIEKKGQCLPFAYNTREEKMDPRRRISRFKELIQQSEIFLK